MQYVSTRGHGGRISATKAVVKGIADDRGLYVPESFPKLPENWWDFASSSYLEVAHWVLGLFLDDFDSQELAQCVELAYCSSFSADHIVPLVQAGDCHFLELFHGPTAAFKDMALSVLPHLMTKAMEVEHEQKKIAILTATSGDTGKAALEGFADVPGTEILVFYPHTGVSRIQQRQMITQEGENTHVFGIRGNFDDAQTAVKQAFRNEELNREIHSCGYRFSSANSINIGRLIPQVVYYVWTYGKMLEKKALRPGQPINVVVPTGNFGNILAAYYASQMGVPVNRLICASNRNHVLTDFIRTGIYDANRAFYSTSSPSMDILVSSNLERLLYHLSGEQTNLVSGLMESLERERRYEVPEKVREGLLDFYGGYATEKQTREAIEQLYAEHGYLMDPHTAVAYKVYRDYRIETADDTPTVIAATASAYKFAETVAESIGLGSFQDGFRAIEALYQETGQTVPKALENLENKPVRHPGVLDGHQIVSAVVETLRRKSTKRGM